MIDFSRAKPAFVPGEAIVRLRKGSPGLSPAPIHNLQDDILERFDFGHRTSSESNELVRVRLPENLSMEEGLEGLRALPEVEYAGPNHILYLDEPVNSGPIENEQRAYETGTPNDLDSRLWALENKGQTRGTPGVDIEAKEAWKQTIGDRVKGPIVAVIDSGVDISHPDLVDNLWTNPGEIPGDGIDNDGNGVIDDVHGYNAYDDNSVLTDAKTHGTHVAGTVGATGNNGFGITGVAQQARIMPIKIFGDVGHTNEATVLRALAYADRMGARITTNSWGGISSPAMEKAYADSPALHIASAGNSGKNNDVEPHFPGSYRIPNMIAVAATDHNDHLGSYSCYGANTVHLGAPGEDIYSTLPRDRYRSFSGTSMACPHVGGVASLILTEYPGLSNEQVKDRLLYGTEPLSELEGKTVSGGRLNARLALENDLIPPGPVGDLRAVTTASSVGLSWTDGGDDGMLGAARELRVFRGNRPLNLDTVAQAEVLTIRAPGAAGQSEGFSERFPLSLEERRVHYGVLTVDNVGHRSTLATVSATIPAASTVFKDGPEINWSATGQWARISSPEDGTMWTDSPSGDYGYQEQSGITSSPVTLPSEGEVVLRFQHRDRLAPGDQVRVQVSSDGERWDTIGKLSGQADWASTDLSLERYQGKTVRLRYELRSDNATNGDGVYLKDIEVLHGADSHGQAV